MQSSTMYSVGMKNNVDIHTMITLGFHRFVKNIKEISTFYNKKLFVKKMKNKILKFNLASNFNEIYFYVLRTFYE